MTTYRPNDWIGQDGAYWAAHDLRYDALLGPLTPHLLAAADLRPDDRVLDVGCGCGNTTRLAGQQAADVLGADLSEAMLARARERTAEAGLTNVRFVRADAQRAAFEPVDVAISQFGVMFFDDPAAAFANLRRAGQRLAFLCWQGVDRNENRAVVRETIGRHVTIPPLGTTSGAVSLADPDRLRELLATAGFRDVELHDVREPLVHGRDADDATEFQLADPTIGEWLADAQPAAARKAADALHAAYAARETPDGVLLVAAAWLVTAR
jgi:SAM-dependent methyltransferase